MNAPPFQPGDRGDVGGFRYRIERGAKGPTDLRLDLWNGAEWRSAPMALGGLMADFFFQNEDRLYPREYGFKGGDMYVNFVLACVRSGWRQAWQNLEAERMRRRRRDGGTS